MVMQRPEKGASVREPATSHQRARLEVRGRISERAPAAQCSIIELGRLLGGFENLRIVPVEDLRIVGIANVPDALIASIGIARIDRTRNRRDQVLVEVL